MATAGIGSKVEPQNVLVVDDEDQVRAVLCRLLERDGYACSAAAGPAEARAWLAAHSFDLLLCDLRMPDGSGLDLLKEVPSRSPGTGVVVVTGVDDLETARTALRDGALDYVMKPFRANEVLISVANALNRQRVMKEQLAEVQGALSELERARGELDLSHEETVRRLARMVQFRHEETGDHMRRVGAYSAMLARELGMAAERCELIRLASPMHDIGKVAVPDRILLKPGRLEPEELRIMEWHTEAGYLLIRDSSAEVLRLGASIAWTHHERWDGRGYPRGLAAEEIPPEGRLTAVADVFDAITTDRVYRPAYGLEAAIELIRHERARHFDPEVVDCFLDGIEEIRALARGGEL